MALVMGVCWLLPRIHLCRIKDISASQWLLGTCYAVLPTCTEMSSIVMSLIIACTNWEAAVGAVVWGL